MATIEKPDILYSVPRVPCRFKNSYGFDSAKYMVYCPYDEFLYVLGQPVNGKDKTPLSASETDPACVIPNVEWWICQCILTKFHTYSHLTTNGVNGVNILDLPLEEARTVRWNNNGDYEYSLDGNTFQLLDTWVINTICNYPVDRYGVLSSKLKTSLHSCKFAEYTWPKDTRFVQKPWDDTFDFMLSINTDRFHLGFSPSYLDMTQRDRGLIKIKSGNVQYATTSICDLYELTENTNNVTSSWTVMKMPYELSDKKSGRWVYCALPFICQKMNPAYNLFFDSTNIEYVTFVAKVTRRSKLINIHGKNSPIKEKYTVIQRDVDIALIDDMNNRDSTAWKDTGFYGWFPLPPNNTFWFTGTKDTTVKLSYENLNKTNSIYIWIDDSPVVNMVMNTSGVPVDYTTIDDKALAEVTTDSSLIVTNLDMTVIGALKTNIQIPKETIKDRRAVTVTITQLQTAGCTIAKLIS